MIYFLIIGIFLNAILNTFSGKFNFNREVSYTLSDCMVVLVITLIPFVSVLVTLDEYWDKPIIKRRKK